MIDVPQVLIVSACPVFATSLEHWMRSGSHPFCGRWVGALDPSQPGLPAAGAILLLAPLHWRELEGWLPHLRRNFAAYRWLVFADLRIAGVFASQFGVSCCTLVAPYEPPDRLRVSLWVLTEGHALYPPGELKGLLARRLPDRPEDDVIVPTTRELECGCAASLGMDNRQIGKVLHITEGTVKGHLARLCRKLGGATRDELAARIERAFAPSYLPPD
jgi:DNA-binding CsgD family transcriptional regulator